MGLTKRDYVDGTIITAQNLNDIQDEIIANGTAITTQATQLNGKADASALADEISAREASDTAMQNEVDGISALIGADVTLPSGYEMAFYIESDGATMYDTGIGWVDHPSIEIDARSPGGSLFGNYHTSSRRFVGGINENFAYGGQVAAAALTAPYVNKRVIINFSDTSLDIGGETLATYDASGASGSVNHIRLFGRKYTGNSSVADAYALAGTRIYGCKLRVGSNVVFDGIPCIREADNVPGFYDAVSGSFITPEVGNPTAVKLQTLVEINESVENLEAVVNTTGLITYEDINGFGTDGVFTSDFSVVIPFAGNWSSMIFSAVASYTRDTGVTDVPYIRFLTGSGLNRTTNYEIGADGALRAREWRVVRYPGDSTKVTMEVHIPAGVTLTIKAFNSRFDDAIVRAKDGIRLTGHRRMPMTPYDTLPGVFAGAKAYSAFVEIPKRLSDGTWICYHDDSLTYNGTYIRQTDGSELPSTYDHTLWSSIDFATANSWDWGISTDARFAGTKPMTLQDFFSVCGKTGMQPVLSFHPMPSASELAEVKALAKKFCVLSQLGIKAPTANISALYSAFGNDVAYYCVNVSAGSQSASVISAAISVLDGLSGCTVERIVELFASTAYNAYFGSTQFDPFGMVSAAGYTSSIAQQLGIYNPMPPALNSQIMWAYSMEWWNANYGVTMFTDEYNWSTGLAW